MAEIPPIPLISALSSEAFDSSKITKETINLDSIAEDGKLVFLLHGVFDLKESERLIQITEATGYTTALIHVGDKQILLKEHRDSLRVLIDDRQFVERLLQRVLPHLPSVFKDEQLVELNERLRFLRYDPGHKFSAHCDCSYSRPDMSARTLITMIAYLNEDFEGGETTLLERRSGNRIAIVPKTGTVLVFEHNILHEGSMVSQGRKYAIRTDVLYTRSAFSRNEPT